MSFHGWKKEIADGDIVILFLGHASMQTMKIQKGLTHQTKYGALRHSDLIGVRYGSKVQCSKGWLYVLHPTPELWTINLPHRTQILYSTDISMITLQLDLKPGSIVVEAGTGSGSLSHAIVRTIAPNGHLYTFDFHEQRAQKAQEEFTEHGIGNLVTAAHRDVCKDGFGLLHVADTIFLDLPAPWEALPFAKQALKKQGGRVCSFSPCIEQVQKSCLKMEKLGFSDIQTMECLLRTFDVRTFNVPVADLGEGKNSFQDVAGQPVIGQIQEAQAMDMSQCSTDCALPMDNEDENAEDTTGAVSDKGSHGNKRGPPQKKGDGPVFTFKSGRPPMQMNGHTGYLTFATLYPT